MLERQVDELMQSWDEENPDSQFLVRVSVWPECAAMACGCGAHRSQSWCTHCTGEGSLMLARTCR